MHIKEHMDKKKVHIRPRRHNAVICDQQYVLLNREIHSFQNHHIKTKCWINFFERPIWRISSQKNITSKWKSSVNQNQTAKENQTMCNHLASEELLCLWKKVGKCCFEKKNARLETLKCLSSKDSITLDVRFGNSPIFHKYDVLYQCRNIGPSTVVSGRSA